MNKHPILVVLFLLLNSTIYSQLPDTLARKTDSMFAGFDHANSPGCALAILKNGEIIYEKGYGMSNLEYNVPISPSSIFQVGSVAKQFTAAAVVELSLEGKLSLQDDIRKYVPELPGFGHTITINHLLHHTSGLKDGLYRYAGWREEDLVTENDVLALTKRQKTLNFQPGDNFAYCNTGYMLLAVVVERVTGLSLRKYLDSVFFKPLGMSNTQIHDDHGEILPNRTSAYAKDKAGKWRISVPMSDLYGSTGLFTTVEDLAKWDENFYTKKIGGAAFIDAMQLTGFLNDRTPQIYASGLFIKRFKGYRTVEHSGVDAGYRANFVRFPDQHLTVIILANLANIDYISLAYQVADLFLPDNSEFTRPKNPSVKTEPDKRVLSKWAGDYYDAGAGATAKMDYHDGRLFFGTTMLEPMTDSFFTSPDLTSTYSFSGDSSKATLILAAAGSKKSIYKKVNIVTAKPALLQSYQGGYYSAELETKYELSFHDNSLWVKWPRYEDIQLLPFIRDVFTSQFTQANTRHTPITMIFLRDGKNNLSGFYLMSERTRNLYFEKIDQH